RGGGCRVAVEHGGDRRTPDGGMASPPTLSYAACRAPRRRTPPASRPFSRRRAPPREDPRGSLTSEPPFGLRGPTNTAINPVKAAGKAVFAGKGTTTKLFVAFTATECAVPAGCPGPAGTLYVGTN